MKFHSLQFGQSPHGAVEFVLAWSTRWMIGGWRVNGLSLPSTFVLAPGAVMSDDGLIGVSAGMGAGRWSAVAT
jgi:hypothetical protein